MTAHDLDARPGTRCPGCAPHPEPLDYSTLHAFLIIAARSPGATACGHYHAEHCSDDETDARALLAALGGRHGYAELRRRNLDGSYNRPSSITTGAPFGPCCEPCYQLPYHWNPPAIDDTRPPARCSACGDPWTLWTRPERIGTSGPTLSRAEGIA